MKAIILAAGRGKRMCSYTDSTPKPLLCIKGKPLIEYHLESLAGGGIKDIFINLSYLGHKIREALGCGDKWGVRIHYSEEAERLETGGAIKKLLPSLGDEPFLLVNADVFTDMDLTSIITRGLHQEEDGHLVLVPNPDFKPVGDFSCDAAGLLFNVEAAQATQTYTFSGVSLLRPSLVACYVPKQKVFPLVEVFRAAIARKAMTASIYKGRWSDVGTPERLKALN